VCDQGGLLIAVEGELEERVVAEVRPGRNLCRKDEPGDFEGEGGRVYARGFTVGEDGFETDTEAADLVLLLLLGAFPDVGNCPYVWFREGAAVVGEREEVGGEDESGFGGSGVFGVLEEFVNEMRAVGVEFFDYCQRRNENASKPPV
jgi:hypothetical protein